MRIILISSLFVIFCSGCCMYVSKSQVMINPKTGDRVNCYTSGFGFNGKPYAIEEFKRKVLVYKSLGYIPIEEAEMGKTPKSADSDLNANKKENIGSDTEN